ncbi:porin [Pseudoalteromonas rubra]|uniref:Porin n=1 Tax=Pseudoalteromonas rubra TaxID=43658 RepID=A0A5S3UWH5_9GAMM|nr:porin [Pseudoalteromonas rubra]QPB85812.1 porin [Pseudoalteromonas rubra]
MKQLSLVAGLATLLAGAPAVAHTINFDKVEVGYKRFSVNDSDMANDTLTGVNLAASKRFENYYVEGRYYSVSDSFGNSYRYDESYSFNANYELDLDQFTLGAGYIHELDETSLFDVSFHIGKVDLKAQLDVTETYQAGVYQRNSSASDDDDIYRLRGQYQTRVLENIELKAGLGYEKTSGEDGDSNPLFFVGAGYHFNTMFSVNAEYRNVDDYNTLDVNFRYSF